MAIHKIPEFVTGIDKLIKEHYPDFGVVLFGHIGDGNLHLNVLKPKEMAENK